MAHNQETEQSSQLAVATWNIHGGRGFDNRYELSQVIDLIKRRDPDVIGIQELDRNFRSLSEFDDQIEILRNELDMQARFGENLIRQPAEGTDTDRGEYGIGIFSKQNFPIETTTHHHLPNIEVDDEYSEQRGLLETQITVGDQTVSFYNTHLTKVDAIRPQQVTTLLEGMEKRDGPQVLVGDFNATPDSPTVDLVTQQYDDAAEYWGCAQQPTRPPGDSAPRIDYIFVTPGIEVLDFTVVDEVASDHLLVESTIDLSPLR